MRIIRIAGPVLALLLATSARGGAASWENYASCAAAYRANWQARAPEPNRTAAMSAMIQEQSDDYRNAAIASYLQAKKASRRDGENAIANYIQANIARYIAMDRAGTLEDFIDKCPQIEAGGAK
jgi:hypothetical protein